MSSNTCVYKKPGFQILKEALTQTWSSSLKLRCSIPTEGPFSQKPGSQSISDHTSHSQALPPRDPEGLRDYWLLLIPWGWCSTTVERKKNHRFSLTGGSTCCPLCQGLTLTGSYFSCCEQIPISSFSGYSHRGREGMAGTPCG